MICTKDTGVCLRPECLKDGVCLMMPYTASDVVAVMGDRRREKINHPPHYGGDTTYEAIKVIEAWKLGFCLGNAVKYLSRAGKKPDSPILEDLKKAKWYLEREIQNQEHLAAEKA